MSAGSKSSPSAYTPRHLAERILTSRTALEGERKQVTVLFCDLAGSTGLAELLGPEAMHRLIDRFFELALSAIHRYEGTVNQFLGDGFMALFGAPLVHEDDARRAVLAAVAIQDALRERRADFALPDGSELQVRIGINTGPVVVGKIGDNLRMDYTAVGDTTNLAARLQQLAEPGAIHAGDSTFKLTQAFVEYESRGLRVVKGKSEPVAAYRVVAARAQARDAARVETQRLRSPLVGRDGELAALLGCVERLLAGQGGIAGIIGEAGLGKSRLIAEARRQSEGRGLTWLEGRALSFSQNLSYWPFLEILRHWAGLTEDETQSWIKLERKVRALFAEETAEVLPYVATWLGVSVPEAWAGRVRYLDGEAMGRQIFRTARRLFDRLARERPVVLVFEDLHWTDQSSTELIEHLMPIVEGTPLLLIGIGRPERQNPAARLRDVAVRKYSGLYTEVALAPLAPAETTRLVGNLLAASSTPPRLAELVLQKSEGNPFFVEEVLRVLIDTGALVHEPATGGWRAARSVDEMSVPDTLEAVILARVDRLGEEVKRLLRLASVIGRSFFYRILRALSEAQRRMDRDLAELVDLELVREKQRRPELEYIFKHALVQEATYGSILSERRREMHRGVAQCMEGLFSNRLDEFAGLLAYHYARAEVWEKAQQYLFIAGDQAGRIAADTEALAHYRQALTAFERVSSWTSFERAVLERKMGEALFRRGQHAEALDYLKRALKLLGEDLPDTKLGFALAFLWEILQQCAHRLPFAGAGKPRAETVERLGEERFRCFDALIWMLYFLDPKYWLFVALRMLNAAERRGHSMGIASGSFSIGMALDLIPAFKLGESYHQRAIVMAEASGHPLALGYAHLGTAIHEEAIGRIDAALHHYGLGGERFREAGHVRGWGICTGKVACSQRNRGEFDSARRRIAEIKQVAEDASDRDTLAYALTYEGQVDWFTGPFEPAIALLETAIELFKAVGNYGGLVMAQGTLVRIHLRLRQVQRAVPLLDDADRILESRGLRGTLTMWHRLAHAECSLALAEETEGRYRAPALAKARRACRKAMAFARTFNISLPAALRSQGRYLWLMHKHIEAKECWHRSLAVAAQLGAMPELAFSHLEIGEKLDQIEHLNKAEEILSRVGAAYDLAYVRELLSPRPSPVQALVPVRAA